jgi:hypothetical protein
MEAGKEFVFDIGKSLVFSVHQAESYFCMRGKICIKNIRNFSIYSNITKQNRQETLRIGLPVLIGEVLKYFQEDGIDFWLAFIYSTAFVIGIFIAAFCYHYYFYRIAQEGIRIRNACIGLLYKRV